MTRSYIFRMLFNPVDYDGSIWREIKNSYKTNELGFFITLAFFGCLGWSIIRYRRNALLEQKKRFVYQQYKKKKFIEEALRLRTREQIIEGDTAGLDRLEYKDYFKS